MRRRASATPVLQVAGAYAAGRLLGGKLTLAGIVAARPGGGGGGELRSVTIVDQANQKSAIDVVLFREDPAATVFTDNAAFDVADADMDKIALVVPIAGADYVSFADNAEATKGNIGESFQLAAGRDLYAALVCRGTPTYVAANDLEVVVEVESD